MTRLFKKILQNNCQITYLDLSNFSKDRDGNESAGKFILEALINANISELQTLNL